ncbi:PREDICTED: kelch repeat and BTB domain-containing protein 12 [Nanorana parkeri]|uniref:kelch repeat and BTB domain-containing protein 12 n=1 Tax=Nanorana parkeri TaxID=125878 RepID=UPI000853FF79|nr:PREDICTED: kelch repeat and BTB domain-containing protein 12 [Nanorana parkeri]
MESDLNNSRKHQHGSNLLEHINRMRESSELIDIVLVAEGHRFPCHRVVLASFSPYFRVMFTCGLVECNQTEVTLHDVTAGSVSIILEYMYTSQLYINNLTVQGVATAAYFMQMDDIFRMCQNYMMDHMDASNCIGIYYFAKQIAADDLEARSKKYLYQHFSEVGLHDEILEVDFHQLMTMIASDDLNVSREESILDLVLRWVNHDKNLRSEHLIDLLKQVRMLLVNPSFLREARKRNTVLLCNAQCYDMVEQALETIEKSTQVSLSLRYGMETTSLLLCLGNNGTGIRSKYGNYGEASFCFAPTTGKICYISSPKQGEALGLVSAGVVTENNDIILAGEATVIRLARQKERRVELCRYHNRGSYCWEKLCSAEYRELYALGSVHNDLYLIGGQMKHKKRYVVTNCVDKYLAENESWRSVSPLPLPLACHAVVTLNNKLYVMGGWTPQTDNAYDEPDRLSNRLLQYDPTGDKWTQLASMKYSKYRFSAAVVNGEIFVLGGIGCTGPDKGQTRKCLDAVEIYNVDADFWRDGPPMPHPLLSLRSNSSSAGVVEGKLYLCGGYRGADRHEVITKEILELDPWENQWNVVCTRAPMHDSYDVCLVALLNPRDLLPPPRDLMER